MDGLITLSHVELERLLITLEAAQQVQRRHQYFLWSQGTLQSFLPHDALIFGHGAYGAPTFCCEVLARADSWQDKALHREIDQLVEQLVDHWQGNGHLPLRYQAGSQCPIGQALTRLGLGHALAHGTKEFAGEYSAFFVFLRMPEAPGCRQAYFAEMLMPYLHTTLRRMLIAEKSTSERRASAPLRLSNRETEVIVRVRDGQTNQQIAAELELSPHTVKNHVQNILRKLKVSNRAQAVGKAVKNRLVDFEARGKG